MASGAIAGDIVGQTCVVEYLPKQSAAITLGDALQYSSTGFITAPTTANINGPWAVALETKASSTTVVKAVRNKGAFVYVTSGGTINPGAYIIPDTGTAGRVKAYSQRSVTNDTAGIKTAQTESQTIIGVYVAHVDEGNGDTDASAQATAATACSSGQVIRIMLGGL